MNKKWIAGIGMAAALCRAGMPGTAIEIPLDGFGKTTSIAYVNMHKVFEAFPETEKARIELNQTIAAKLQEISSKKEEIATLKGQIGFLKKQMGAVVPSTAPKTTAETPPESVTPLTLPENSPLKFLFSPPENSTSTATEDPAVNYSTFTSNAPQILPGSPSPGPSVMEKEAELATKESELEVFIGAAEDEIRQMEEGKSMTLLARIYRTLEDISTRQGYSVVLEKSNVLYGESVIDITDQLIQRLNAPRLGTER